MDSENYSCNID